MHQPVRLVNHVRLDQIMRCDGSTPDRGRLGRNCGLKAEAETIIALAFLRLTLYRLINMDYASQGGPAH
jgi:hypothetical protein